MVWFIGCVNYNKGRRHEGVNEIAVVCFSADRTRAVAGKAYPSVQVRLPISKTLGSVVGR
jgi:hypothetical protein